MTNAPSTSDIDVVALVIKRWRTLLLFAALGTAAATAYAFITPEWYEARLTVIPAQPSRDAAAMSLSSKLPMLDIGTTDSKRIEAVLTSVSVTDEVIDKFDLVKRYGVPHREQARQTLWGHCSTALDRKSGVVALTCEDTDPKLAMEITASFGEIGNRVFSRVSASSASEEARFLEGQVDKARKDVDDASQKLRDFQEQHRIIDLPEQSKAVISAMASLKGELLSKQLELSYLSSFSASTESNVVQLQQQIAVMEAKLKQLESQTSAAAPRPGAGSAAGSGAKGSADFFPSAMQVPELRFELEQLMRDQKIKETVFSLMTQRYEVAKIDAARDTSTFQILDHPTLPTMKARPVRRKLAMLGFIAGLALAAPWIGFPIWWRRRSGRV
jgi:capsule polysaccharide export protein KpsE/RkpR